MPSAREVRYRMPMWTLLLAAACSSSDSDTTGDSDVSVDTEVFADTDGVADTDANDSDTAPAGETDETDIASDDSDTSGSDTDVGADTDIVDSGTTDSDTDVSLPEETFVDLGPSITPICESRGRMPASVALMPNFEWIGYDGVRATLHSYRDARASTGTALGPIPGLERAIRDPLGGLLVSDGDTLYTGTPLVESPLGPYITAPVVDMAVSTVDDTTDMWLSTGADYYRWRDGLLTKVTVSGADGRFVAGGKLWGRPALWVAADGLFGLAQVSGLYKVIESLPLLKPQAMTLDSSDHLWVVGTADGDLWRRDPAMAADDRWSGLHFEAPITDVRGNASSSVVWARDNTGKWYHISGSNVSPIVGGPSSAVGVDDQGHLIGKSGSNLVACGTERDIGVLGLFGGEILAEATTAYFVPFPAADATVKVRLDGVTQTLTGTDPWKLRIDPNTLSEGRHTLVIDAGWGAETASRTVHFDAGAHVYANWDDVQPIFAANCSTCHSSGPLALSTEAKWIEKYSGSLGIYARAIGRTAPASRLMPDPGEEAKAVVIDWATGKGLTP